MARTQDSLAFAVQQVRKCPPTVLVVGLDVDPLAVDRAEVIPVQQHRTEAGHQAVDDVACLGLGMIILLRQAAAHHRTARAHHVHRMRRRGSASSACLTATGRPRNERSLALVGLSAGLCRQHAVDQQVGDLLELTGLGEIEDVVAAIVQIVARPPDRTDGGVACDGTGQGDGLLRLQTCSLIVSDGSRCQHWPGAMAEPIRVLRLQHSVGFRFEQLVESFCSNAW